jgi:hypothetical protein
MHGPYKHKDFLINALKYTQKEWLQQRQTNAEPPAALSEECSAQF